MFPLIIFQDQNTKQKQNLINQDDVENTKQFLISNWYLNF